MRHTQYATERSIAFAAGCLWQLSLGRAHHKTSLIDFRCCYAKAEAGALSLVGLAKTAVNIRLQLRVLG